MERWRWNFNAWIAVMAIPMIPVAYAYLCAEGPAWIRPSEDLPEGDLSALFVTSMLLSLAMIIRAVHCFIEAGSVPDR